MTFFLFSDFSEIPVSIFLIEYFVLFFTVNFHEDPLSFLASSFFPKGQDRTG